MKLRRSNQKTRALTLVEVLVVIAVLTLLFLLLLPALSSHHDGRQRMSCVNNLKQVGLAFRLWEGDNGDKYPMAVSVTNGGAMELVATGNVMACFQTMSNQLSTPKILLCPYDKTRFPAATDFSNSQLKNKISYFVGVDAVEANPQMFLSGDDNFEIGGVPVKSGLAQIPANANIAWSSARHVYGNTHFWTPARNTVFGNIAVTDGSVQQLNTVGLQKYVNLATNRLAIP